MSINGLNGATSAPASVSTPEPAPATGTGGTHKTLYGDPSRGEGVMNTMSMMKQLAVSARAVVSSRNTSLQ